MASLASVFLSDPEYKSLMDGGVTAWGDFAYEQDLANGLIAPYISEPPTTPIVSTLIEDNWEADVLNGWSVPDLMLRKGIWENFPVDVVPLSSNGTVDRFRIRWNQAKLDDWRFTRASSYDEYQEYEAWCRLRLADAFATYSNKYVVEDAEDDSICIIAMEREVAPRPKNVGPRALDVLKAFPVSWDREMKIHRIKLHRVNARNLGAKEADVTRDLKAALALCGDCVVSAPVAAGYMLTVTLI